MLGPVVESSSAFGVQTVQETAQSHEAGLVRVCVRGKNPGLGQGGADNAQACGDRDPVGIAANVGCGGSRGGTQRIMATQVSPDFLFKQVG